MKLIIAGGRKLLYDWSAIHDEINELEIEVTEIVSGGAAGIDKSGERYAEEFDLPLTRFLPNWEEFGKAAGPIRNKAMALYGDALLLIWDGKSRGSTSMRNEMKKLDKPVYEVILD